MAVGSYGIIRPSDVSPEDVEIYFHYVADRNSTSTVMIEINLHHKDLLDIELSTLIHLTIKKFQIFIES